jgi:hypothetical protein
MVVGEWCVAVVRGWWLMEFSGQVAGMASMYPEADLFAMASHASGA